MDKSGGGSVANDKDAGGLRRVDYGGLEHGTRRAKPALRVG